MPTIKVSDKEYGMILQARKKVTFEGVNKLPSEIRDNELSELEKVTLGAIVGIGALMLLKELNKQVKK